MRRRTFLQASSVAGLTAAAGVAPVHAEKRELARRPYGDTGIELSIITFGGIVVRGVDQAQANASVAKAVERGVNYFDVAPTYGDAEERLGPALEPFRDDVFLSEKTQRRDAEGAEEEFHESLKKLRTDHFELYQLHALSNMDQLDEAFAPGGAMEFLVKARDEGMVKYLGFSAHNDAVAIEAMERFPFDSVMFPFNYATWHHGGFGPEVMAKAKEIGAARLALKAMARNRWPEGMDRSVCSKCWYEPTHDEAEMALALRFTLSLDVTTAIPPGDEALFFKALDIGETYTPLEATEQEMAREFAMETDPLFRTSL